MFVEEIMEVEEQTTTIDIVEIRNKLETSNLEDNKKLVTKYLTQKPDDQAAIETLSDIYSLQGNYIAALIELRKLRPALSTNILYWNKVRDLIIKVDLCPEIEPDVSSLLDIIFIDSSLLLKKIIDYCYANSTIPLVKNSLFIKTLGYGVITYPAVEILIVKERKENLYKLINNDFNNFNYAFMLSMCFQAYLTEYMHYTENKEHTIILQLLLNASNKYIKNPQDLTIRLCIVSACTYFSLNEILELYPNLRSYCEADPEVKKIFHLQVRSLENERKIREQIKSLTDIQDKISKKVRAQYEEFPYPRWYYAEVNIGMSFKQIMKLRIPEVDVEDLSNPKVLIAGCGTGRQTIYARTIKDAKVTSVDLSLSSLAYAIRKCREFNFNQLEFYHADLMQLDSIGDKYDVIECVGVLHHTRSIEQGLKILLNCLKDGGYIKLGLYSEIARKGLSAVYKIIKENNLDSSLESIRTLRNMVFNKLDDPQMRWIASFNDFYTTSMAIDLTMHKQELRITIPKIKRMLKKFNLRFIGFEFNNFSPQKQKYKASYPEDPTCTNLDNWQEFEVKHPETFKSMYQFTIQKIS